jgi:hypothetical protein
MPPNSESFDDTRFVSLDLLMLRDTRTRSFRDSLSYIDAKHLDNMVAPHLQNHVDMPYDSIMDHAEKFGREIFTFGLNR